MSGEQSDVFRLVQEVQKLREALAVALDRIKRLEFSAIVNSTVLHDVPSDDAISDK